MVYRDKQCTPRQRKDQFDVIEGERYINGPGGAKCTSELKKLVRLKVQNSYGDDPTIQIFGFEYTIKEINRAVRFIQQYPNTHPQFPLIGLSLKKSNCADILIKAGILLPAMYLLGYNNNNCIGCVKGGKGYWNKIRIDFPEYFNRMAKLERWLNRTCINGVFLDELDPEAGRDQKIITPDCGSICEIKFEDIIDTQATFIFKNPEAISFLY